MASATGGKVLTLKSCLQALTWHFLAQDVASSPCGASAGHPLSRDPHRILCPRHGSVPVPNHTGSYGQCDTSTRSAVPAADPCAWLYPHAAPQARA